MRRGVPHSMTEGEPPAWLWTGRAMVAHHHPQMVAEADRVATAFAHLLTDRGLTWAEAVRVVEDVASHGS